MVAPTVQNTLMIPSAIISAIPRSSLRSRASHRVEAGRRDSSGTSRAGVTAAVAAVPSGLSAAMLSILDCAWACQTRKLEGRPCDGNRPPLIGSGKGDLASLPESFSLPRRIHRQALGSRCPPYEGSLLPPVIGLTNHTALTQPHRERAVGGPFLVELASVGLCAGCGVDLARRSQPDRFVDAQKRDEDVRERPDRQRVDDGADADGSAEHPAAGEGTKLERGAHDADRMATRRQPCHQPVTRPGTEPRP